MIVPSLYADLRARGVKISIARTPDKREAPEMPETRLHIRAPQGALNETLRAAIANHRDELLQFVFELEETAATLAVMQGNRIEDSERLARECVRGGLATPDGALWLREYAEHHPDVLALKAACQKATGNDALEIISVERVRVNEARAA